MPSKAQQIPGYVYKTAAIPEEAYKVVEAYAKALRIPITQAIGLIVVATGPHLPALLEAQQEAAAAKVRELVKPDAMVQAHISQRRRRREVLPPRNEVAGVGV